MGTLLCGGLVVILLVVLWDSGRERVRRYRVRRQMLKAPIDGGIWDELTCFYQRAARGRSRVHLVVAGNDSGVTIPAQYGDERHVVFDISPRAIDQVCITPDGISFATMLRGQTHVVRCPKSSLIALYQYETGEGVVFRPNDIEVLQTERF